MKPMLLGILAVVASAALVAVIGGEIPLAHAQLPGSVPSSELIALSMPLADRQQVTIVDPRTRVIGVYHVDAATGAISLRSVRNINWDLQMTEFNAAHPAPQEVRSLVQQQ